MKKYKAQRTYGKENAALIPEKNGCPRLLALKELSAYSKARTKRLPGEAYSPAEDFLLSRLIMAEDYRHLFSQNQYKKLISIGKRLGLYPIPDWYRVKRRFEESNNPMGLDVALNSEGWSVTKITYYDEDNNIVSIEKYGK